MIIRQIWQHSSELQAKFEEVTNEYLGLVKQVKYITKVIFVIDDLEVSSIVVPYSDFVCSRLYSSYSEDSKIPSFTNKDTNPQGYDIRTQQAGKTDFEEEKVEVSTNASVCKKMKVGVLDFGVVECSPIKEIKGEKKETSKVFGTFKVPIIVTLFNVYFLS